MLFKPLVIVAAFATAGAASAYAQTTTTPPSTTPPAPTMQDRTTVPGVTADTRKLLGRNVQNAQNETIGEIEAIHLSADGKVAGVIIGVGGFLGMGERDVRVAWKDLVVADNGEKVTVKLTKDQLKAMPEYRYRDPAYRGKIFSDTGVYKDGTVRTDRRAADDRRPPSADRPPAAATRPTRDFNADGHISTEAVLEASVRNAANEKIGEVEDVYVDAKGQIQTVVVSVGGFLGIGKKHVAVKWSDLQTRRDGGTLVLQSNWTKDSLKTMPDYKYDREEAERK